VTPEQKLEGRAEQIWKDRDAKLEGAASGGGKKRATQEKLPLPGDPACN
jgi:hypothetical protein